MRKFVHVVGARPNFMKLAPVYRALAQRDGVQQIILHTGQHYDYNMSDVFFQQLGIPQPDVNLKVGSGTHAQQTAEVMVRFEAAMLEQKPDCVLVYGDVNSTVAAAMVCAKLLIPLAHVEAGLRSGDKTMPEEVNRVVTDRLADLLFTPSIDGNENLAKEGVPEERVHLVGNVMIDTLIDMMPAAQKIDLEHLPSNFILTTLHRPANVDDVAWLSGMIDLLERVSTMTPVVLPLHPRTRERLNSNNISLDRGPNFHVLEPRPYLEFLALQLRAKAVVTDSGGVQEETTYLGIPCLTMRDNTERPVTISEGTNVLVGRDLDRLNVELEKVIAGRSKPYSVPQFWDGMASHRIAQVLTQ